jgi:glycosyltransferase involved in cell wall biosynthesis
MIPTVAIIGTRGYPSYYGGFETLVRRLAPYLVEAGWRVTVYGRPDGSVLNNGRSNGVYSINTRGINSRAMSTLSYGLTSSLHSTMHPTSVALVMNVANGYWLPMLKMRGIPAVVNVDGIEWERNKWGPTAKRVFRTGATLTAKHAHSLVFDSQEIAGIWKAKFDRSGTFIPYGADAPISPLPLHEDLRHRGYILLVARFVPENTISEFFEAARILSHRHDVVLVGSSGFSDKFDQQAMELSTSHPRIRWYGHVSNDRLLQSLWHHAGAYFHGHTVGGTNPALVQAMASGAPTLAVDTPFNREVLEDTGIFVPSNTLAITKSLDALMSAPDLQNKLASAAAQRAKLKYSWERVCEQYVISLEGAAKHGSRPHAFGDR